MARKKRGSENESDSLELLLDTVSNVFGGVMFLTLLASLLVIARSVESVSEKTTSTPELTGPVKLAKAVELETRDLERSLETMREVSMRMDADGTTAEKLQQRRQQIEDELKMQADLSRKSKLQAQAAEDLQDQKQEVAESKKVRVDLEAELDEKSKQLQEMRKAASRKVFFRPLRRDTRPEAVVILRYGRMYLLKDNPKSQGFNADDFFVIESTNTSATITAKPHRGIAIDEASATQMVANLKRSFPSGYYKVSLAVWGDTFEEFNTLRNELINANYTYRTLPMKPDGVLYFGMVENPLAQ